MSCNRAVVNLNPSQATYFHTDYALPTGDLSMAKSVACKMFAYILKELINSLTLYLIETPINAFANRADPDHAALIRAA